ncbi:MAG: hypothetical protein IJ744_03545 [Lachnospiraceae bacterium]|nr:hypothetical protein [Lachnospiraceae bacterium]
MIRRFFSQIYLYLLWLIVAVMFWGWIFSLKTDTSAEKKVMVFADVDAMDEVGLSAKLEEEMPEGIRMVQAHPFSYVIFNENLLVNADVFIVPENEIEELLDTFAPMEREEGETYYEVDGVAYGKKIYDAATKEGPAKTFITYTTDKDDSQDYYLFYGIYSLHTGSLDEAAYEIANHLLCLP